MQGNYSPNNNLKIPDTTTFSLILQILQCLKKHEKLLNY